MELNTKERPKIFYGWWLVILTSVASGVGTMIVSQGASVLMVVFTGQMLFGIFGVGGEMLVMGGHERLVRRINLFSLSLCFVACLLLVPSHGGMGAAVAGNGNCRPGNFSYS